MNSVMADCGHYVTAVGCPNSVMRRRHTVACGHCGNWKLRWELLGSEAIGDASNFPHVAKLYWAMVDAKIVATGRRASISGAFNWTGTSDETRREIVEAIELLIDSGKIRRPALSA